MDIPTDADPWKGKQNHVDESKRWIDNLDLESNRMGSYEKYSNELYGILCGLTTGDAKLLVRGVKDQGAE